VPDLQRGRWVAIKMVRPDVAQSLGAERFLREIRLAAQVSHPHILAPFDSGEATTREILKRLPEHASRVFRPGVFGLRASATDHSIVRRSLCRERTA
jgi:hypothetical protein